jgi:putative flippase GtrA
MSGTDASSFSKNLRIRDTIDRIVSFSCRDNLWMLLRFAIVGTFSAITYLVVSLGLSNSHFHLALWVASLAGFAVSFFVSYFGHLFFTYRAAPDHVFHGPRFVLATLALMLTFSVLSQVLAAYCNLGRVWSNLLVVVLFPPCSFLLHTFWSFAARTND